MPDSSEAKPPLHLIDAEADKIYSLAASIEHRQPEVAALLMGELDRAVIHTAADMPRGVVTMGATVDFVDEANGKERRMQLVYPHEADVDAGRLSILSFVGAGLIGLAEGDSIVWPDREGHERRLRIVRVAAPQG